MYAVEMASCGMIYLLSFMKVGLMKCAVEMDPGGMIYVPSSTMVSSGF
jgi:hypothetical protein